MYTFLTGIALLVIGYFTYEKFVEKLFGIKPNRPTPAYVNSDGVDYVPMNVPKNSLIQLLNIAGTGPVLVRLWVPYTDRLLLFGSSLAVFLLVRSTII